MNPTHSVLSDGDHEIRGHRWSKPDGPRLNIDLARFMELPVRDAGEGGDASTLVSADDLVGGSDFP